MPNLPDMPVQHNSIPRVSWLWGRTRFPSVVPWFNSRPALLTVPWWSRQSNSGRTHNQIPWANTATALRVKRVQYPIFDHYLWTRISEWHKQKEGKQKGKPNVPPIQPRGETLAFVSVLRPFMSLLQSTICTPYHPPDGINGWGDRHYHPHIMSPRDHVCWIQFGVTYVTPNQIAPILDPAECEIFGPSNGHPFRVTQNADSQKRVRNAPKTHFRVQYKLLVQLWPPKIYLSEMFHLINHADSQQESL